jgi:N-acetylneuraminic acid mutarotase
LHSTKDFARFDPKSGKRTDLAPLPEGRSSHDAAVLGNQLFVVGGWELGGAGDGKWHDTALVCDLTAEKPAWKETAKPPFMRRALAVAASRGKIYVMGGMDDSNEMSAAVNIYDPQSARWSLGPVLPGKPADDFGASAFGSEKHIFVTNALGTVYRLAEDGQTWEEAAKLQHPRTFHRLLLDSAGSLIVVGGTARGAGKVAQLESLRISK